MDLKLKYIIMLSALHGGLLVAANAVGAKVIAVGPFSASATVFVYAFSFLITDIVSEVFGKRMASFLVLMGFIAVSLGVIIFHIAVYAPSAAFFEKQECYNTVFKMTWRILLGGLSAYLVSQFLDVTIFHKIKEIMQGRFLWLRNNVSTMISQFIDTSIFIIVGFAGEVPNLMNLIIGQYLVKVIIAGLDTPIAYLVIGLIKRSLRRSLDEFKHMA